MVRGIDGRLKGTKSPSRGQGTVKVPPPAPSVRASVARGILGVKGEKPASMTTATSSSRVNPATLTAMVSPQLP